MFAVIVKEKGGEQRRLEFDKAEITIGRVQGNDVILPKGNVSKRHARIVLKDGKFITVDLKSTNGTYVNGRKIASPAVVKTGDNIYIGDFILSVEALSGAAAVAAPAPAAEAIPADAPPRRPPPPPAARPIGADPGGPDLTATPPPPRPPDLAPPPRAAAAVPAPPPRAPDLAPPPRAPDLAPPPRAPDLAPPPRAPDLAPPPRAPDLAPPTAAAAIDVADRTAGMAPPPAIQTPPAAVQVPPPAIQPPAARPVDPPSPPAKPVARAAATGDRPPSGDPRREKIYALQKEIHEKLIDYLDLRRLDVDSLADEELWDKTERAICDIVEGMDSKSAIPAFVDQDLLVKDVLNEALGLGPLEDLLAEDEVDEIMVNRHDQIYIERSGRLELSSTGFSSDKAVLGVIERIVAPLGRRIDESSPLVDARLKDGSRVNAVIPPLALKGPCITIRKFRTDMLASDDLVRFSSISQGMIDFLKMCVTAHKNIVISGGTGSGKTTTLNVVSNFIPDGERIISIEDAAELQLRHEHWVQLESRPANIEGKGNVAIRDLVRNSLRMRPDRIVVGECRGGEALDMLQAMNTGHDGSLTTAHSNSPRDTLARLETMVLMSGMELPIKAIREQISSAIDIICHQSRFSDGSRRITHITEVSGMEGDIITIQDIFSFKQEGFDSEGKVQGRFVASGFIPRFYEDLQRRGLPVDMTIFRE